LLEAGKFDDAVAAYDGALAARLDSRLRFLAHEGKGYALEGKGDLDRAAAAFGELEQDAAAFNGFYKERAIYQKARVTERKGDKAGALKLYRQVLEKSSDSLLHDEITDRLAVLEAK
jgi:tetratricopeptide (TPR) repeat protein